MIMEKSSTVRKAYFDKLTSYIEKDELVKNLDAKKQKTSVFIGSSSESHHIAKFIKYSLDLYSYDNGIKKYEVDTWKMSVFGGRDKEGNELTIAEQLKNFTDIYDFAIFLFVPDEDITANTRVIQGSGEKLKAEGVKHNVIFEFGLFLGRLGAKRSIVLYEESIQDFIDLCFTDLKDEFHEKEDRNKISKSFKLELLAFKGKYKEYISGGKKKTSFEYEDLKLKIAKVEKKIADFSNQTTVGFLPSTSLAIGYFNNFLDRVHKTFSYIISGEEIEKDNYQRPLNITEIVRNKKRVVFKIVLPNELKELEYQNFQFLIKSPNITISEIKPKDGARGISVYCNSADLNVENDTLRIYDFPTTLNSSIETIMEINEHADIQELLSEKEKQNFRKAITQILTKTGYEIIGANSSFSFELIDMDKFKMEIEV